MNNGEIELFCEGFEPIVIDNLGKTYFDTNQDYSRWVFLMVWIDIVKDNKKKSIVKEVG